MKLSSCRELKRKVQKNAYSLAADAVNTREYRMRKAGGRRKRVIQTQETTPIAAIGVAPGKQKEYKLAVRIFRGMEHQQDALLKGLDRHMSEIDLATGVNYKPRLTLKPGGSIGHYKITAGTLGGFVEDSDHYYLMSNNHVFANSNQCFDGDPIVAPGPMDAGGSAPEVVANLDKYFPLSKTKRDGVDAAIARFSDAVDFFEPWNYTGVGRIKKTPVSDRFSVGRVIKRGRTTGVTRGVVTAFELDGIQINYGTRSDPAVVTFDDQIEVIGNNPSVAFSAGGDSGSFIIDRDSMEVYALLYGGGPDSNGIDRTLAHFMPDVFKKMKVKLVQ
ncbi:MAG: hypothetical protein AB8G18_02400 [Gammaproteobacteria bacterium]